MQPSYEDSPTVTFLCLRIRHVVSPLNTVSMPQWEGGTWTPTTRTQPDGLHDFGQRVLDTTSSDTEVDGSATETLRGGRSRLNSETNHPLTCHYMPKVAKAGSLEMQLVYHLSPSS